MYPSVRENAFKTILMMTDAIEKDFGEYNGLIWP